MYLFRNIAYTILALSVLTLGCAGPKWASHTGGKYTLANSFPPKAPAIYVRAFSINCDVEKNYKKIGSEFSEILVKKISNESKFPKADIISIDQKPLDGLIVEGEFESIDLKSWSDRSFLGAQSLVRIRGRVFDPSTDQTIITFEKSRSGIGGLAGAGGYFAAGSDVMLQQLMDWLADDITEILINPKISDTN